MTASSRRLRSLIETFLRVALRLYYRSIQVQGMERFPRDGPVLVVANHPGSLLDPAILVHLLPRRVVIGAKHTLFHGPLRPVLEAFEAIPIVRAEDDVQSMRDNLAAFERYVALLAAGQAAAIFPEGITQDDPRVAPVKTGAARIALQAEAAAGGGLGVQIVPVGLQFEPRRRVRADVLVRFGRPLSVGELGTVYERDPRDAVLELTERIQRALESVAFHVEAPERVAFVTRLADVYLQRARRTGIAGVRGRGLRAELLQKIAAGLNHYAEVDPASIAAIERGLERYERLRAAAGIDHRLLEQPARLLPGSLAVVQAITEAAIGLPAALFGVLTGGAPFYVATRLARRMSERDGNLAALSLRHILFGAVAFPLVYGPLTAAVWWRFGNVPAIVFGALLIPAGLFALVWCHRMRQIAVHLGGRAASVLKVDAVARVRRAQDELLARMDVMRDRYRSEVLRWEPLTHARAQRRGNRR